MMLNMSEFIGRLHPVLVHLPIGILLMAVALQWLAANPKYGISQPVVKLTFLAGIAGALLSCITGFLLSNNGDYEGSTVAVHMWLAIVTTTLALLVIARIAQHASDARWLSLLLLLLVALTGHFGGSLTHGDDYLTAVWEQPEGADQAAIRPIANVQEANVYADVVQPLLQSRCYNCHGAQKQKGGLRMDTPERLLKGGKNGAVIEGGNALESELVKRLLLPREDEDHMPPKEKPQLTESQIALVHWWIEQGAPFDKKIAELQQPEKVKPLLASLQENAGKRKQASFLPTTSVPPADERAVQVLRDKGVVILPIDKGSCWLAANFVTADFGDADAKLLLPLKQQLLFVKMNDAAVGDATMDVLGQCTNIAVLHLNHTQISDKGLARLSNLHHLRSLSLVGTNVSLQGLSPLRSLPQLENLYLYGTEAVKRDWQQLKALFPHTKLDSGGYRLPLLASDTSLVPPPKR